MSTTLKLTPQEYDQMIARGAFVGIPKKIELIHGELREMNPAGPVHEDYIDYLNRWSIESTIGTGIVVRIQNSISADDSRPEPDLAWIKPGRYADRHPTAADTLLLIEVAESSLPYDRGEKLQIYAQQRIPEYWIVDITGRCLHMFSHPEGDRFQRSQTIPADGVISPLCREQAVLTLADLLIA
jgi:Uma2 family endonuclease